MCFWKDHREHRWCDFGDITPCKTHTHTHSLSVSYPTTAAFQLGPLDGTSSFDVAKILAFPHPPSQIKNMRQNLEEIERVVSLNLLPAEGRCSRIMLSELCPSPRGSLGDYIDEGSKLCW